MKLISVITILVLSASALCAQTYEQEKAMDPDWGVRGINLMASVGYSSTIVGGPEWNRAFADCTCCSALGPVRYHVQKFYVDTTGAYDILSVQQNYDGYIFVYEKSFDPLAQTTNCLAGDDDGPGGIGTSEISGLSLTAGTGYLLITTAFENGEEGAFDNTISGPGNIRLGDFHAVPSLSQVGILIFAGLLAIVGISRIRNRFHA